jgi:hypothetical protein
LLYQARLLCVKRRTATSKIEDAVQSADSTISATSEKINDVSEKANAAWILPM